MNKNYKLMFGCLFSLSLSSFAQGAFDVINTQIGVGFASLTSIINKLIGWRLSNVLVTSFGFLVTFLTFFIHEPRR